MKESALSGGSYEPLRAVAAAFKLAQILRRNVGYAKGVAAWPRALPNMAALKYAASLVWRA
jgi:hypothetical protein